MSDALKDIRDALSSRTQHFVLPKQWASMRKAEALEKETGKRILHFEKGDFQGDEFYPAPHIYEAAAKAVHDGHVRYVPGPGLPELRDAIAEEMTSRGRPTKREEVLVTMGAKHALTQSLLTIVDQGDEVIFPNPGYPPDEFWITYAGGKVVYADDGPVRVMVTEQQVGAATEPTLTDLSQALIAVYGTDYGVHSPTWLTRFSDTTRQAASYRDRRVLLAGDAAHVHAPDGGQRGDHPGEKLGVELLRGHLRLGELGDLAHQRALITFLQEHRTSGIQNFCVTQLTALGAAGEVGGMRDGHAQAHILNTP